MSRFLGLSHSFTRWFRQENMGRGEDGKWISHKSFRVLQVPGLWSLKTFHQESRGVFLVQKCPSHYCTFSRWVCWWSQITTELNLIFFFGLRKQGRFDFRIRSIATKLPWNSGCLVVWRAPSETTIQKHDLRRKHHSNRLGKTTSTR